MKNFIAILFLLPVFSIVKGKVIPNPVIGNSFTRKQPSLFFLENKGQITDQNQQSRSNIQFKVAATPGLNIFIGNGALHYQFCKYDDQTKEKHHRKASRYDLKLKEDSVYCTMYRMDVVLQGTNANPQMITKEKQDYYENYFTASTAGNGYGVTAYAYSKITYKNIYPHIDWVLYFRNGHLEHEFIINQGGNIKDIQLKYCGATSLTVNADGSLTATTPQGTIKEDAPISYDENGNTVKSNFKLNGNTLLYETANYAGKLVIDPTLDWATYFGGGDWDWGESVVTDQSNNVYITGFTTSTSGIATSGAYEVSLGGTSGTFLAKFNSLGSIQWATYYGAFSTGEHNGVATDNLGNVYVTGETGSIAGIATPGAYKDTLSLDTFGVGQDCFLAKFNGDGFLQWGTYFGGERTEYGEAVAVDNMGNVFMTGLTHSITGIATPAAYQTIFADSFDAGNAFLAKFDSVGALQWATYFGASYGAWSYGVTTDAGGDAYITGETGSTSGLATPGAYQVVSGGDHDDAFLTKFSGDGALLWSTYYGGNGGEGASGIASDDSGNVYITGTTTSTSGIATPGAYQYTYGGNDDAFLAKFSATGAIQWSTYYGGTMGDRATSIAIDGARNIWVVGYTSSSADIATPGGYQTTVGARGSAFLTKFNNMGTVLWGSYYGGDGDNLGNGVAVDVLGNIFIVGTTESTTGIATPGSYQPTYVGGLYDAFLAKFLTCDLPTPGPLTGNDTVFIDSVIVLTQSVAGGTWKSTDTGIATVIAGMVTGVRPGIDTITYSLANDCGGAIATKVIYVVDYNTVEINNVFQIAQNVTLYPNPAQKEIIISSPYPVNNISIFSVLGQQILCDEYNSRRVHVDIENLPPGVYVVKINHSLAKKFVKQ